MKKLIKNYKFDSTAKTIEFTDYLNISLSGILLITNTTDNIIIYNFADPLSGGSVYENVLTLLHNTTLMSNDDALQIYYDDGVNPLTDEELRSSPLQVSFPAEGIETVAGSNNQPFLQDEYNIMFSRDANLERVLGITPLVNANGRLKVEAGGQDVVYTKILGSQGEFSVDCTGMSSATLQTSGTWAGTHYFEATVNGGDWVILPGINIAGALVTITNTNSNTIHRFNVAGFSKIRTRFTWTSGSTTVTFRLSPGINTLSQPSQVSVIGSQTQILAQKANPYELLSYDTNIALALSPQADPAKVAPVAPTLPSTYVANALGTQPQRLPMLRTQDAGSERMPFAQQANTFEMKVINDAEVSLLEKIYYQLVLLNQSFMQANSIPLPQNWEEFK